MALRQDWSVVYHHLQNSLFAEQMVCSMSTQLFFIPRTQDLEGNIEMHNHLVPASYHRITAAGSAYRLQSDEHHESIVETLVSCINNAKQEDKGVREGLQIMREAAPVDVKPFIDAIIGWQDQAEQTLALAEKMVQQRGWFI
ncbi:hypothetical protein [Caldalkalibacillus thermarum]|uniref:hypothetical protein n=1 Tax=Caldalkalibacillus thermarum TaxID=296745 RepID=UPI001666FA18|nr:hypothetical protein [Caldalkalibacillus thermarum]